MWLVEEIGADVDILSFAYESRPALAASISTAALGLRRLLAEQLPSYMHLFFITHGSGLCVVQEAIHQDVEACGQLASVHLASVAGRSREIFSLCTKPVLKLRREEWSSMTRRAVAGIGSLASMARNGAIASLSPEHAGIYRSGLTQIKRELGYHHTSWERYGTAMCELSVMGLPRPKLTIFTELDDQYVTQSTVANIPRCTVMAMASTDNWHRIPCHSTDFRVGFMARHIKRYVLDPGMIVAYCTVRRAHLLDETIRLVEPLSATKEEVQFKSPHPSGGAKPKTIPLLGQSASLLEPTLLASFNGSQALVYESLIKRLSGPGLGFQHITLTGPAGIGKSVLLRRLALSMSLRYIETGGSSLIPVLMPLQQLPVDSHAVSNEPLGLLQSILGSWCNVLRLIALDAVEEAAFSQPSRSVSLRGWHGLKQMVTPHVALQWLSDARTVLLADSVDEWLTNSTSRSLDIVSALIEGARAASHGRGTLVLGVRDSLPGLSFLADRSSTYEVSPLSLVEAEQIWSGPPEALRRLAAGRLSRLILSPLILTRIGPVAGVVEKGPLAHRTEVMMYALEALLDNSHLPVLPAPTSASPMAPWIHVLSAVAWLFYRENAGVLSSSQVQSGLFELKLKWSQPPKQCQVQRTLSSTLTHCCEKPFFAALRSRTVLIPVGEHGLRFVHREWQDFLVARYLASCIQSCMGFELAVRAFDKRIYCDAAWLLSQDLQEASAKITAAEIETTFGEGLQEATPLGLMSYSATLGNGPVPIGRCAYQILTRYSAAPWYPETARLTLISSFCMRLLRREPSDLAWDFLLLDVMRFLDDAYQEPVSLGRRITASMAWCYARLLRIRFAPAGISKPPVPWSSLSPATPEGVEIAGASGVVWHESASERVVDRAHASFQIAAVSYALYVKDMVDEEVSLVHYLFLTCAALQAGVVVPDALPLLRLVFSPSSGLAERVARFDVPEVESIFRSCHHVHQDTQL